MDLSHINEDVRPIAGLDAASRIAYIREDYFVVHPFLDPIMSYVHFLLTSPSDRVKGLYVACKPNGGKSSLARDIDRKYSQEASDNDEGHPTKSVIRIGLTDAANSETVFARIVKAGDGPVSGITRDSTANQRLLQDQFAYLRTKILLLDEFSDLMYLERDELKKVLSAIKFLLVEARVVVAAFGTSEGFQAFASDEHMAARFKQFALPSKWRKDRALQILVKGLQSNLPLREPSTLLDDKTLRTLLQLGERELGNMVQLIQNAAAQAILDGQEYIDEELLRKVAKHPVDLRDIK